MDNLTERDSNVSHAGSNSTGHKELVSEAVFQALGGLATIVMIIGIPGNILVIVSISLNKQLRTAANFLVMSLSVFDLLFLTIIVPVHTYTYLTGSAPPHKVCWAVAFVSNWLLACSVLSTGSIAINRYIAIVLSSKYRHISGNKAVFGTCFAVFLFPFVLLSPSFEPSGGTFAFGRYTRICSWATPGILPTVVIGCVIIFPMIFMTLCYIRIVLFVVASRKRVGQTSAAVGTASRKKETRLSLMLAMVYIVYLVTTLPSLIIIVVGEMGVAFPLSHLMIAFVVVWISTAANPVMYGFVNKKYRDAYKNVAVKITSIMKRTETETVETNTG